MTTKFRHPRLIDPSLWCLPSRPTSTTPRRFQREYRDEVAQLFRKVPVVVSLTGAKDYLVWCTSGCGRRQSISAGTSTGKEYVAELTMKQPEHPRDADSLYLLQRGDHRG